MRLKKTVIKKWIYYLKGKVKGNKSQIQKAKRIHTIQEYFKESPIEYNLRYFVIDDGKIVDYVEVGYNKDENFKILNHDWEEIKKRFITEAKLLQ